MRYRQGAAALGAAAAITIGAVVAPALAQDLDETTTEDPQGSDGFVPDSEVRMSELASRRAEALAAELELPVDEVEAALEAVDGQFRAERRERRLAALEGRLDAAVEEGSLTREQADAILEAADEGVFDGGHLRDRGPGHVRGRGGPAGWGGRGLPVDGTAGDSTG